MDEEDFRKMEQGEEVEQQSQAAGETGEHVVENIRETMVNPKEQETEKDDVSPAKEGVEGASALELEQPLPIAEEVGESLVVSTPVIKRVDEYYATLETENRVAMEVEESPDVTVNPTEEMEQQFPTVEKSVEEPTAQMDDVMDIARQIAMDVEPYSTTEAPEETHLESMPMETTMMDEPTEETEQPLLTPEEVAANLAARNSEVARVDMEVEENLNVDWNPTERVGKSPIKGIETNMDVPEMRDIVIVIDEEEEAEKVPRGEETAEAKVVAVRTYQRRPVREETSENRSEEVR